MRTLNVVGGGRLGRTLARLWQDHGVFRVLAVCNRSEPSAAEAARFIAENSPPQSTNDLAAMPAADCWLIATADEEIGNTAHRLAQCQQLVSSTVVFHCSGSLNAAVLEPCRPAQIASAHPIHSFADPSRSLETFTTTSVAIEGDRAACGLLRDVFEAIGAKPIGINGEEKPLYHAASVFACNYLTVLLDLSLQCYQRAGIEKGDALQILAPILQQTLDNNLALGPENALTGPVARGDLATVRAHLDALQAMPQPMANAYRQLALAGVDLARRSDLPATLAEPLLQLLNETEH